MNHYLIEIIGTDGCDYTIACNRTNIHIEVEDMEQAKEKFIALLSDKYSDKYPFTRLYDNYRIERITIYAIYNASVIDMIHMMQAEKEQQDQENQQEQEEKERTEYERLKAKYNG